jgi:SpoVK/Ycf46/Vps4 family AAA+-type ATPase
MEKFIKKVVPLAFLSIVFLQLLVYLTNTYFNWRQAKLADSQLIEMKRKNNNFEEQMEKNRDNKLKDQQLKKIEQELAGFQGEYELYQWDDKKGYLGIQGIEEVPNVTPDGQEKEGILCFSDEVKKHFAKIVQDIDDWANNEGHQLQPLEGLTESFNIPYLTRNNCILYGAPGTGKTEFVRELNHILINRYGQEPETAQDHIDPNDPNAGMTTAQNSSQAKSKTPQIPIFEIKGASLMSTGKDEPKTYEKLIATIRKAKKEFFQAPDENGKVGKESSWPYIVFIEEADQAKNPLNYNPQAKNNLEELKNFFSTGSESAGLAAKSQDRNSIVIVATNNYETIDPAMKRWGRLGISLNFTWNPETIYNYSQQPQTRIDW